MISIILATKNGEKYIDRAIQSVLDQTEQDFELIIISDGSTDTTVQKVKAWTEKDSRIKLVELTQNIGPGKARDRGIRESSGTYIAIIDDDDYWISPEKLRYQKEFLHKYEHCVLVGSTKTHIVDEHETLLKYYSNPKTDAEIRSIILRKNPFITSSVLFKKSVYEQVGGFSHLYLNEDYDLWLRMGLQGTLANIDNTEVAYTIRPESASKKKLKELYKINLDIVMKHRKNYPKALAGILKGYARIILFHLKNFL